MGSFTPAMLEPLFLTLKVALLATLIAGALGIAAGHWMARHRFAGQNALDAVLVLPMVLPPTVLGYYLLIALGPLTAPGRMLIRIFGHPLAFSFTGLLIGSVLYSLPFAVQPLVAGFSSVDTGYVEASAGLGVSPWRTFWSVVMPLSRASLLTSAVLAFTHTVGEFGVVLMIGGNIPGATRTLSISLYDQVQDFNYAAANRTALLLLVVSLTALVVIYLLPSVRRTDGRQVDVVR